MSSDDRRAGQEPRDPVRTQDEFQATREIQNVCVMTLLRNSG
jgi:hypothetical protein